MQSELSPSQFEGPPEPVPAPLRGAEVGSFAWQTVTIRMPEIGRRTLAENEFPNEIADRLEELITDLPTGRLRPLQDTTAPDAADWERYVAPYVGQDWLEAPWFFVETYFYRRILEATGYFQQGPMRGFDPFASQKRQGLEGSLEAILALASRLDEARADPGSQALAGQQQANL
ncbi:MAG TPA: ARMT1-like domain-containing protein, partial [Anaerolineales bacterium]